MKGIRVDVVALTTSFRDPIGQLYHGTLPLPPPSTLLGLGGAALGKSLKDVLTFFQENKIKVGCIGTHQGQGNDLWNYTKLKNSGKQDKDIIIRKFLYGFSASLYYLCENDEVIEKLYKSFLNPYYGLTLGNSDELIKIKKVNKYGSICKRESNKLRNTWVCGNQTSNIELNWDELKHIPITKTLSPPLVKRLPTSYIFDNKGARQGQKHETFTFLGETLNLVKPVPVYFINKTPIDCFQF